MDESYRPDSPDQNPTTHRITDFFSFYSLPSTIIQHPKYDLLDAAYLFYYASDVAFDPQAEEEGRLKKHLNDLIEDALIVANQARFDVFNALTLMDNFSFLQDLKASSIIISQTSIMFALCLQEFV
jgi:glycylpeptide N-tetradecanoyltransferase